MSCAALGSRRLGYTGWPYKVIGNRRRGIRRRQHLVEKAASNPPEQQTEDPLRSVV